MGMTRPLNLDGAVAVLTGAGSGIGRMTAVAFAERGASVVVSDVSEDRVTDVVEQLRALGRPAIGLPVDVTVEADLEKLRDAALERFGRIDVVMNNVGVLAIGAPETLPDEAWIRTIDVNLFSIARSNRVFLPGLIAQGSGHVVNTASASGLLSYGFDRLPYVASKHAIVGLSEALAIYLGPKGIGVTCLCPSGVMTNILEGITVYGDATATPRAPAHQIVTAEDVGRLTAEAIEAGRFLVLTAPEVHEALLERATDIEAYLQASIEAQG
jgi:NAD(P)-dependent dehydrogenase (short-subunit alcohol dehydrogenase family)